MSLNPCRRSHHSVLQQDEPHQSAPVSQRELAQIRVDAIEVLIIHLQMCGLALVSLDMTECQHSEAMALANKVIEQLQIDRRYMGKLFDLFQYHTKSLPETVAPVLPGMLPELRQTMWDSLEDVLQLAAHTANRGTISRERAIGIAEGAIALMVHTGACDAETSVGQMALYREKLQT